MVERAKRVERQRLCPFFVSGSLNNHRYLSLKVGVLSFLATLWLPRKRKTAENQVINSRFVYPDSGSNRDGLLHWCLRPTRLPIPPSGLTLYKCGCKDTTKNRISQIFYAFISFFLFKNVQRGIITPLVHQYLKLEPPRNSRSNDVGGISLLGIGRK